MGIIRLSSFVVLLILGIFVLRNLPPVPGTVPTTTATTTQTTEPVQTTTSTTTETTRTTSRDIAYLCWQNPCRYEAESYIALLRSRGYTVDSHYWSSVDAETLKKYKAMTVQPKNSDITTPAMFEAFQSGVGYLETGRNSAFGEAMGFLQPGVISSSTTYGTIIESHPITEGLEVGKTYNLYFHLNNEGYKMDRYAKLQAGKPLVAVQESISKPVLIAVERTEFHGRYVWSSIPPIDWIQDQNLKLEGRLLFLNSIRWVSQ